MRYIFPLLIPASMLMGELVDWWKKSFVCGAVKRTDSLIFRSNVWLVAIAVALLPVAGWIFMFSCGKMTLLLWFVVTWCGSCIGMERSAYAGVVYGKQRDGDIVLFFGTIPPSLCSDDL